MGDMIEITTLYLFRVLVVALITNIPIVEWY